MGLIRSEARCIQGHAPDQNSLAQPCESRKIDLDLGALRSKSPMSARPAPSAFPVGRFHFFDGSGLQIGRPGAARGTACGSVTATGEGRVVGGGAVPPGRVHADGLAGQRRSGGLADSAGAGLRGVSLPSADSMSNL